MHACLPPARLLACAAAAGLCLAPAAARATFLIEIDTDGLDDGIITYNPNFSFGGDTTTASQSIPALSFGLTGGDSIFGGDGVNFPDTYVYTYDPSVNADNLAVSAGTDLGAGNFATGLAGGVPGTYAVYGTWPFTTSVSGGLTRYSATTAGDSFTIDFDQNGGGAGAGHNWYKMGEIAWTSGPITVTQFPTGSNSFVSMRSSGLLFERIPEPATLVLFAAGLIALVGFRRTARS